MIAVQVSPVTAVTSWRRHCLAWGATVAVLLLLFAADARAMAWQWWNSSTYGHCLFILPLIGWLLWLRRNEVARVEPRAWLPGLFAMAGAAGLWLLGDAAGVALVRQAALVLMIQASVPVVLGIAVVRAVLFPLFYLVFLVPFGDEIVPAMQTLTARLTMALLALTGVPAQLDGVFITTSFGWFEVAEACAGVKFLVAMVAYGALVANVCFCSAKRRMLFMALCVAAPILANGVRAFGTIYAAKLTSVEAATGFDHLVYGWVFFALVIALVMAVAWRFFDRRVDDPWLIDIPQPVGPRRHPIVVAALAIMIALMPLLWNATVVAAGRRPLPHPISLPRVPGWQRVDVADDWRPRFDGADHRLFGRYRNVRGHVVDVGVALYAWQGQGRQVIGYGQGAIDPASDWAWSADLAPPPGARAVRMLGPNKAAREAVTFYVLDGRTIGQISAVKLATLRAKLLGGDQAAAVVIISAPEPGARASIEAFLGALGPADRAATRLIAQARD